MSFWYHVLTEPHIIFRSEVMTVDSLHEIQTAKTEIQSAKKLLNHWLTKRAQICMLECFKCSQ